MRQTSRSLKLIATYIPKKRASHPSTFLSIIGIFIFVLFILYIITEKYFLLTLKVDSNIVVVRNCLWDKLWSNLTISNNVIEYEYNKYNKSQSNGMLANNEEEGKNFNKIESIPKFDKFISCTFQFCSGIGNQMFRFASLYSIGRYFNRSAFFNAENQCQQRTMPEIKETFPNFFNNILLLTPNVNETLKSDFALDCCKYQNPDTFHNVEEKYLILNGNYLQSYKYFNQRKKEIRYLFDFSLKVKDTVEKISNEIFGSDSSHKLCIHIRRGDFIRHEQLESRSDFIEPAISFLHSNLTQKGISIISLIFLGNDRTFTNKLNFNRNLFEGVYMPELNSRGENMYFGIKYCNTFLISASGSTFAWWIGYLLPERFQVFYNAQISKKRNYARDYYDFDFYPPEWNMLELNNFTKTVAIDNRWFYERFSWPMKGIPPIF